MRLFRIMATHKDVQYTQQAHGFHRSYHKADQEDPEMWKRVVFVISVRSRLYLRSFSPKPIGIWRVKKLHVDCPQSGKRELL